MAAVFPGSARLSAALSRLSGFGEKKEIFGTAFTVMAARRRAKALLIRPRAETGLGAGWGLDGTPTRAPSSLTGGQRFALGLLRHRDRPRGPRLCHRDHGPAPTWGLLALARLCSALLDSARLRGRRTHRGLYTRPSTAPAVGLSLSALELSSVNTDPICLGHGLGPAPLLSPPRERLTRRLSVTPGHGLH